MDSDAAVNISSFAHFGISPTLYERLGSPTWPDAGMSDDTVEVLGQELPVRLFSFAGPAAAQAALDRLLGSAETPLAVESGKGAAGFTPVLALREAEFEQRVSSSIDEPIFVRKVDRLNDREALCACSRLMGLRLVYLFGGTVEPPQRDEPGTVFIFANSRPPGSMGEFDMPIAELFGLNIWSNRGVRYLPQPTRGRGRVIEGAGAKLFQVLGRNYYPLCLPWIEQDVINLLVRDQLLRKLLDWLMLDLARPSGAAGEPTDAAGLAELLRGELFADLSVLTDEARARREKIRELEGQLAEQLRGLEDTNRRRRAIEGDLALREQSSGLEREAAAILAMPGVLDATVVDRGLHVRTEPVVIAWAGRRYDLGGFIVRLDMQRSTLDVWSEAPRHPDGHHHPHVDAMHLQCFGSVSVSILKCLAKFRYAEALEIVLRWLNTYNPDNTLYLIEGWPAEASGPDSTDSAAAEEGAIHA
jgi:hypothetical protein